MVEKQNQTSSDLNFNKKDYEVSLKVFAKFEGDQLSDCGDGIGIIKKVFTVCFVGGTAIPTSKGGFH